MCYSIKYTQYLFLFFLLDIRNECAMIYAKDGRNANMIITDKNTILGFLRGHLTDYKGRLHEDIMNFDDKEMEKCHDSIQQIFPLHEISKHANTYPVLTPSIVDDAKQDNTIQDNMRRAKDRFERFLAIGSYEDVDKQRKWCQDRNHNLLRITRAIRCLRIFGLDDEATDLYRKVVAVGDHFGIGSQTIHYWQKAYNEDVWESLQD